MRSGTLVASWCVAGGFLVMLAAFGTWISPRFGYDFAVIDIPARGLAAVMCLAGVIFAVGAPRLVAITAAASRETARAALWIMIAAGFAARLVLVPSEPMLEDDYQRYLWDGAISASGLNPYAVSPKGAALAPTGTKLRALVTDSGAIHERIGHPYLKTIYPPVAQAAFALAHLLAPWSLVAWKTLLLACDVAVLALIIRLLDACGRARLWVALYWWNPLVIKELFNSGHMEALVMAPVLLALLLAIRGRSLGAVTALGIATGAKVWPVLLLPLLLRPLLATPRRLVAATVVFVALCGLWLWPILTGGIDETSGFIAYAGRWQTNSALFPALDKLAAFALSALGAPNDWGNPAARGALAFASGAIAIWMARSVATSPLDLVRRAGIVAAALVLLSPAQYPWYAIWFLPFLPFLPSRAFLVLTATLPLYYLFFHLNARGQAEMFHRVVVWLIWVPAWVALVLDMRACRHDRSDAP